MAALESAWESGSIPELSGSIPPEASADIDLLTDLVCVDLEYRIQQDVDTRIEMYTAVYPELGKDDLILLELIRTEYTFRADRDSVNVSSYTDRFPHLAHQIEAMFRLELDRETNRETSPQIPACSVCHGKIPATTQCLCETCGNSFQVGRYQLLERVGEGGFGFVYRAYDPKLDRQVAVKVPRSSRCLIPEEVERFLRESRNSAQLDHSGIVRVFDTGRQGGTPYIVSEFVEGESLAQLAKGELEFEQAATWVKDIAKAIGHAHDRGVIHRDLKPSNIVVCDDGHRGSPRVMDFGLARREQTDIHVTLEGQVVGTPAYMSPEQARGDAGMVGPQSDVYSLGVILFQLLCGEVPFRGNVQKLVQQVIHDDPPTPSRFRNRIPRDLETICMKAIQREPSARYGSANALSEDLSRWLRSEPVTARRIGIAGHAWRWCRRKPVIATLLLSLAISLIAGVSGIWVQWRAAEAARVASEADLNDALESVDRVLGHLGNDALDDIPQAKQLRAEVLNDALEFFDRFRQRKPDDPRLIMHVARAHFEVGRIQNALGKKEIARDAFQSAIEVFESLEDIAPDPEEWAYATTKTYSSYANLLKNGNVENARTYYKKSIALRRNLAEQHPEKPMYLAKLNVTRVDLALILQDEAEAEAMFNEAVSSFETLVAENKAVGFRRDFARVLNIRAGFLVQIGKYDLAEQSRQRAIGFYEECLSEKPDDESYRAAYAGCCMRLLTELQQQSRVDEFREFEAKAIEAYTKLTSNFPATPRHRERFLMVLGDVGDLALAQKRYDDAIDKFELATLQGQMLVALFPNIEIYQKRLSVSLGKLAKVLIRVNRKSDAEDRLRESLVIRRKIAAKGALRNRIHLAVTLDLLADVIQTSQSKRKQEEALQLRQEIDQIKDSVDVSKIPEDEQLSDSKKLDLLGSMVRLAIDSKDFPLLERTYLAKIEILTPRFKARPTRARNRSDLAKHYGYLGKCRNAQQKYAQAVKAYRVAVDHDEVLLQEHPASTTYLTQLLSHTSSLGSILLRMRKADEAVTVVRRSLEIAESLLENNYQNFRMARVVLAKMMLGNALSIQARHFQEAIEAYQDATELSEAFKLQPGMEEAQATVLNTFAWFLITCPDPSLRDYERAITLAQRALEISPEDGNIVGTEAFALFELNKFDKAIERLQLASKLEPDQEPMNRLVRAMAEFRRGSKERAQENYALAIEKHLAKPIDEELFEQYRARAANMIFD